MKKVSTGNKKARAGMLIPHRASASDAPPLTLDNIGRYHRDHEFDRQRPYNPTSRTRIDQDGIEVGRGRLWQGILIDVAAKWSKDPKICAAVTSRIEVAISRGHDAITYTDDCGERIVIVGEIRK